MKTSRFTATLIASSMLFGSAAFGAAPQDTFEPNDDCTSPPVLVPGTTTGLTLGPDDDYFVVSAPANATITVDVRDTGSNSLDVELLEFGCGTLLASASVAPVEYFNCEPDPAAPPVDLVILVPANGANDLGYTIDITEEVAVDDPLEDNDSCGTISTAPLIQSFTTVDLLVTGCDEDHFLARLLRSGVQVQVDVLFSHADGDVDVELLEFVPGTMGQPGSCGAVLGSSTSTDDNESIFYTYDNPGNPTLPRGVVVRVFMKGGIGLNEYALSVCFGDETTFPLVGTQVCQGVVNSTGRPSTLCGVGSALATDNNLDLYVVDLPPNSVGYFITAPDAGFTPNPGGSLGNLCLGTPGRYSFDVLPTGSASTGAAFYRPDLSNTPIAGGSFAPVVGGQSQLWQFWHRDNSMGAPVSNFSSALRVDFQ